MFKEQECYNEQKKNSPRTLNISRKKVTFKQFADIIWKLYNLIDVPR